MYVVICDRTGSRFSSLSRLVMRSFNKSYLLRMYNDSLLFTKRMKLFGNFYVELDSWLTWMCSPFFHLIFKEKISSQLLPFIRTLMLSRIEKKLNWKFPLNYFLSFFHWTRANFFCLFLSTTCRITKGHRNSTRENDRMLTPNPSTQLFSNYFSFIFWQRISRIED